MTPVPPANTEPPQVNEVARQAGANPITLPSENPSAAPMIGGGEISPTGVPDLAIYPSWTDAKDAPSWYAKGADVDALLDVAGGLDWLADTGDLNETYQPPPQMDVDVEPDIEDVPSIPTAAELGHSAPVNSTSVNTLPRVDSNVEAVVPPLPSLFGGTPQPSTDDFVQQQKALMGPPSSTQLLEASGIEEEALQVFDTPMEEHDFVSTILESASETP